MPIATASTLMISPLAQLGQVLEGCHWSTATGWAFTIALRSRRGRR